MDIMSAFDPDAPSTKTKFGDLHYLSNYTDYAVLYLCNNRSVEGLDDVYEAHVEAHNKNVLESVYPNAGFDLLFPKREEFSLPPSRTTMVNLQVKGEMRVFDKTAQRWKTSAYYVYPRSSMSKTPLMLANHVGIIDSGYRGWLIGAFRNLDAEGVSQPHVVEQHTRLLQICAPDLRPVLVQLVNEDFYETTERGEGGFGSTGR